MTRRLVLVLASALALLAGTTVAQAALKPSKHKLSDTLALRVLTSDSNGAIFTGTIKDKTLGPGAAVIQAHGAATATVNNIQGTAFFKKGSITVKGSITTTPRADGSGFDFSGTAKAVSGTGIMRGVKGTVNLAGSSTAADPAYQTYTAKGTLTY